MKEACFAGGCFWCIEPVFQELPGVYDVVSGYTGGTEENPSYEDVKAQRTGHRESIRISYDPWLLSYEDLLDVFLESVDPFDGGGQFIDRGRSYTLAVYYAEEREWTAAEERLRALGRKAGRPPCVAVEPLGRFWEAEEYHQHYYRKHPEAFAKELEESGRGAPKG